MGINLQNKVFALVAIGSYFRQEGGLAREENDARKTFSLYFLLIPVWGAEGVR